MNIYDYQIGKAELLSMTVFTVGSILDHVTTFYGLSLTTIKEVNPVVLMLIGSGSWNLVEVILMILGNGSVFIASNSKSERMIVFSMTALLIAGTVRLLAGFHNMIVICSIACI